MKMINGTTRTVNRPYEYPYPYDRFQVLPVHNTTYWPHQAEVDVKDIDKIERWCYNHLKSKNWRNTGHYFGFKRDEDYVLFALKWL